MKKILLRISIVLVIAAVAWGGYTAYKKIPQARQQQIPTTKVRQGDVIVKTFARGELRAVRSASLFAPNLFGTVQVTKLASLGSFAREKDLVAEFDDSELLSRLEEKELEIEQIDEQIKKARADLAIRNNQDQVELMTTKYSVRRAELEVKRNELISAIDAKRNLLTLEESQRRLKQLESDIISRRQSAEAELAVLQERRNKAVQELNREKQRLSQVKLLSPMSGLVAIRQNRGSGFMMMGQQQPDIREGDQLQPGMPVADILDLSELEVVARVGELDRANLTEGQDVVISLDAMADKTLQGKIKSMSGTASANIFSSDPAKKFDVVFSIDMKQLLSALGASEVQIARVLATAEANRKRGPIAGANPAMAMMGAMGGGLPGGAAMMAMGGAGGGSGAAGAMIQFRGGPGGGEGGGQGGQGGGQGGPGGGGGFRMGGGGQGGAGGGFGGMTDEQRTKMREAMQKALGGKNMQDLSPEERQDVFTKMQAELQKAGITMPGRGERKGGEGKAGEGRGGEGGEGRRQRGEGQQKGEFAGEGGGRRGGGEGPQGGGPGMGGPGMLMGMGGGGQQFTSKDIENAKLPPPPEEDDQLEVLLRPGLLADVEIIVEKIPNAIHVPVQAVFEKDGKSIVYVKEGTRLAARTIKPVKRSESVMIVSEGVKPGEEVALMDPDAKPGDKKGGEKGGSSGGGGGGMPMSMPGGGRKGG